MRDDGDQKGERVPIGGLLGYVERLWKLFAPVGRAVVAFFWGRERARKTVTEKALILVGAPSLFFMLGLFVWWVTDLFHPAGDNFLILFFCVGAGFLLAALVNDLRSRG